MSDEKLPDAGAPASPDGSGLGSSRIESPEHFIMIATLVILTVAIVWGVLSRYVVPTPASWVEEVSSIAFAWLIFVGAAEVHRRRHHISVDLLTTLLPDPVLRFLAYATEVILVVFCLYAAYLGATQALASRGSFTSILRLPLWIGFLGLTFGFLMMAFRSVQYLYRKARAGQAR